ncbi:MAG: LysR family transcriptional regulator [Thermaceae bacterium]|nr:LysR family transcriptional regulator [Thermaceae bacterium]
MRLNPRYLMVFCVVAELRSLSRAAEALNLSQPAVSKMLRGLEDIVRQPLYERTPRGITLTQAGRDLLPYACAVSQSLDRATRFIEADRSGRPIIQHLGLSWSLIPRYQAPLLRWAAQENALEPHLTHATSLELIEMVGARELDGALTLSGGENLPEPLEARRVALDEAILVVAPDHSWAKLGGIPLGMLEGARILLPQRSSRLRLRLEGLLQRHGIVPAQVVECGSPFGVRTAAIAGLGVGVVCQSFVQLEVGAGLLSSLIIEGSGFSLSVQWITHPEPPVGSTARELTERLLFFLTHTR